MGNKKIRGTHKARMTKPVNYSLDQFQSEFKEERSREAFHASKILSDETIRERYNIRTAGKQVKITVLKSRKRIELFRKKFESHLLIQRGV